MAKKGVVGWLHEPLAAIFTSRAKVAVLRVLWRAATPIAYREVVRRTGMAYGSVDLALGELTATGLVEEQEGGRERRVRFRPGHRLAGAIASLLQAESDYFPALRVELRAIAQAAVADGVLTATIVGSVARREEVIGGDLELVLIAADAAAATRAVARFDAAADSLFGRFGVRLKLISYDAITAHAMWRKRTTQAERDVRESELLAGAPLADVLHHR